MNINQQKKYVLLSCLALAVGILFYAFYNEVIIIRMPVSKAHYGATDIDRHKKLYTLYFWKDGIMHKDQKELISSPHKIELLNHVITSWLQISTEEKTQKKVQLEAVLLDSSQLELLISFDRNPFLKESSTHEKWMWIESLLKTLRDSGITLQSVKFLIHHKPIIDYHLDFSRSWPLNGFSY